MSSRSLSWEKLPCDGSVKRRPAKPSGIWGLLRDDRLCEIVIARIEGHAVSEMARPLGISIRFIERMLQLIRHLGQQCMAIAASQIRDG
jgi:hypothetical protein